MAVHDSTWQYIDSTWQYLTVHGLRLKYAPVPRSPPLHYSQGGVATSQSCCIHLPGFALAHPCSSLLLPPFAEQMGGFRLRAHLCSQDTSYNGLPGWVRTHAFVCAAASFLEEEEHTI